MKKYILIISGFGICLLLGFIFQIKRESKLKNSIEITGVVTYRDEYQTKGFGVHVKYVVNDTEYNSGINCDCRDIEVGDTVLIKYAVEDPKLAVMVNKYYMQKYR